MTSYTCRAILSLCICAWLAHAAEHQTKDVSLGLYKTSNLLEAKAASEASSMEVSGTLARSLKQRKTIRQQPQKQLHRPTHEQLAMATRLPTTVQQLLFEYDAKSWFPVAQHMARIQRQQDCEAARYLLIDDINTVSGMGWSILTMVPLALQALVDQRVLVHASSVVNGVTWAWCQEPPHSVDCYFRPWTPCLAYLRSLNLTVHDMRSMTAWNQFDKYSTSRFVSFVNASSGDGRDDTRDGPWYWAEPYFASPRLKTSRFWWYGLVMSQYFRPNRIMANEAVKFLLENDLQLSDTFIVANVRHGSKGVEQAMVAPELFIAPIQQMAACLQTNHVLLVTETAWVAARMLNLSKQHGFHLFTVNYTYPDADQWNRQLTPNVTANLTEVARVSALVLAITRRASGFIGTLQSAWAKISVSHMYGARHRPVPAVSLASGWAVENSYKGEDKLFWTFNPDHRPWPCAS